MAFSKPVVDLIKNRYSCRKFRKDPLSRADVDEIGDYILKKISSPFQINARFKIVEKTEDNPFELKGLGTYGFIKNPSAFIIGAVEKGAMDLEGYGFLMERMVLFLTSLGVGSCWLGGSFNKSNFARKIKKTKSEIVPAVLAIGYMANSIGVVESVIRWSVKAKKRKRFSDLFFRRDFEHSITIEKADPYHYALEMVRLAPSASNKQPWRVVQEGESDIFHFFLQRSKGYYQRNKKWFQMEDLQRVDMGIAVAHFELSAKEQGIEGVWQKMEHHKIRSIPDMIEYVISWLGEAR